MGKSLKGAEIMAVGTWNDITFTGSDLDQIVAAFSGLSLSGRIPLKFGHGLHDTDQPFREGLPALGWVDRIYRQGEKLLADFSNIPGVVYDAIKKGMYRFVSVELLKNVQAGTRILPWVLDAVALLGADQPAVGTLKDLQALTMKRGPQLRSSARVAFRRDTKLFSTGGPKAMTEDEVKALLKKQADELTTNFTSALKAETTKIQAAADKQVADAQAAAAKDKAEAHRSLIKAKFESAVKAEALLPAKRESFYKFNRVDDDASVIQIKLEDVDAYITEYADKAKLSRKQQTQSGGSVDHAATNDLEVTRRAEELAVKRGGKADNFNDVHAATKLVLSSDKKLAKAYFADPAGAFNPQEAA